MTVFFLVVGLEIKRELVTRRAARPPKGGPAGGRRDRRDARCPPRSTSRSPRAPMPPPASGIAMPTDIVFVLAVLTLARNAPAGLKAFLLTLAIVDDLGASDRRVRLRERRRPGAAAAWRFVLFVGVRVAVADRGPRPARVRRPGVASWVALDARRDRADARGRACSRSSPRGGVPASAACARRGAPGRRPHPGRTRPAGRRRRAVAGSGSPLEETVSPLARAEALLLPWSSFVIVRSSRSRTRGSGSRTRDRRGRHRDGSGSRILVSGSSASRSGSRSRCCWRSGGGSDASRRVRRGHVLAAGAVAGIPFTVSLFVAELALPVPSRRARDGRDHPGGRRDGGCSGFLLRAADRPARGTAAGPVPPQVS